MNPAPRPIVEFQGGVSCRSDVGPLSLTLVGRSRELPDELVTVAFSGAAPQDIPEALEDVRVEHAGVDSYGITSNSRRWLVSARAVHVHRDVTKTFYRTIVPRVPSLGKRMLWSLLMALVSHSTGKRLLLALRRR
jgi:hypothetical protein